MIDSVTAKPDSHYDAMVSVTLVSTLADKRDLSKSAKYLEALMKEFISYDLSYQFIDSIDQR